MGMKIVDQRVPSSDGKHILVGKVYIPDGRPIGIYHVIHGMTEYIGRYDRFMREMADAGWLVCGYDHLGHGQTVSDPSELGYIAHKGGWDLLCCDVKVFSDAVRAAYGQDLPYVLMGHSMGSFIARLATERYVTPDALIIMGTGGPNPATGAGIALTGLIGILRGDRHISKLVYALVFGGYIKPFKAEKDIYAWISTDIAVRDAYRADPLCTFRFTVSAMGDLIRLTKYANRKAWFKAIPSDLPILLVSGSEDPVGGHGKGVEAVRHGLERAGKRVTCRLYSGYRHEILNDECHGDVVQDIQAFLQNACAIPDSNTKETL